MDADIREVSEKMMKENPVSPYLGFMCDTEEISNEISAISTVLAEYRARIETGIEDESVRQEFVDKLNACGADRVVECYQKQLDAWLASK